MSAEFALLSQKMEEVKYLNQLNSQGINFYCNHNICIPLLLFMQIIHRA